MSKKNTTSSEISQAVKEIPTLIVEEIKKKSLQHEDVVPSTSLQKSLPIYKSPHHSRRWMLTGVILSCVCILAFWFVYISNVIEQNKATLNPAKSFTDSGQHDISMLISTFTRMEDKLKGTLKTPAELKAMVLHALLPLLATSSTTSTANITTHTTSTDQISNRSTTSTP